MSSSPLSVTDSAVEKVAALVAEEQNDSLMLRVYIVGGGCSGFQYGFSFIETQDLGKIHQDGSFEVLGRFDNAEIRGCNLLSFN